MLNQFGATLTSSGIDFKVWAPAAQTVDVIISSPREARHRLVNDSGVFSISVPDLNAGTLYKFQLDGEWSLPDPYSRYQPEGPHGPSMAIDPNAYVWHDDAWTGVKLAGQIIYELHIGSFTEAGTFDAAIERLGWLQTIGITLIEIMPVAEFPGEWNWGYDGVDLFAPFHGYGDSDALKRFVDRAHELNIGVILDVVYNHVGPDGNFLPKFSPHYFSARHANDWGQSFDLDGEHSKFVRQFIIDNACYWIREFHLDGLRLDATQNIPDDSPTHLLAELVSACRKTAGKRSIVIVAEDEQQQASRVAPMEEGGFGLDGVWNDDFHHSAYVALTGRRHAYYHDHTGRAQEFVSAVKYGYLYQGQHYHWQRQPRGQRKTLRSESLITFIDNHDQIANSLRGSRIHTLTSAARYRAMVALLLLSPQTPLLFMGQEFNASVPFLFFADHKGELAEAVRKGRGEFLSQFPNISGRAAQSMLTDRASSAAFSQCKLPWHEAKLDNPTVRLYRDLIAIRKSDPVIGSHSPCIDGAVLSDHAFVLRWFDEQHGDRLLVVNFGADLELLSVPEPLLASSMHSYWDLRWSSQRVEYGGLGVELPQTNHGWYLPAETATLLEDRAALSALER